MSQSRIAHQVDEFNVGFNVAIGPELAEVFAREQRDLIESGVPETAVRVGETVADAPLLDSSGESTSLAAEIGDGPAVLVFYRGAWCPYCNITLKSYQRDLAPALRELGVKLIAISPQTPDGTASAIDNGSLDFTVLSDPGGVLTRALGIVTEPSADARAAHTKLGFDVADSNADATAAVPFPTVLVVSADRVVRFADVHVDYTSRTEAGDIIDAVDSLNIGVR